MNPTNHNNGDGDGIASLIEKWENEGRSLRDLARRAASIEGAPERTEAWRRNLQRYKKGAQPSGRPARILAEALEVSPGAVTKPGSLERRLASLEQTVTRLERLLDELLGPQDEPPKP